MRLLRAYDWPGNVRELFAAVESAAVRAERGRIEAQHRPASVRGGAKTEAAEVDDRYRQKWSEEEARRKIETALREADGLRSRVARRLGMSRTTLWRKMKKYGIDDWREVE